MSRGRGNHEEKNKPVFSIKEKKKDPHIQLIRMGSRLDTSGMGHCRRSAAIYFIVIH